MNIHFILRIVTLSLALTGTAAVAADRPTADDSPSGGDGRLQELAAELALTDEQKEQIVPILEKERADLKALREDTSLRRIQKARRAKTINEKAAGQIRALLTPEQQEKYDALRSEMRKKAKERLKARREAATN